MQATPILNVAYARHHNRRGVWAENGRKRTPVNEFCRDVLEKTLARDAAFGKCDE
jgi:hypothetical protein